jgi:hypothetical protein
LTRPEFVEMVYQLCEKHGGSVTSGFRTPMRNAEVDGHPQSRHLTGYAMDVVLDADRDGIAANDVEAFVRFRADARLLGIKVLDEHDHLHCQPIGVFGRVV